MKNKLPVNSYADKLEIQSAKYSRILHFLGNQYEVFSTIEIIAQLLELSRSSTSRTLKQMVRDGLLIEDNNHWIHGHKVSLYAINQAGLLAIDAPLDAPSYDDRATSNYINHKIQNQRIAIIIQKQLEAEYKCERELRIFHKGLKKIPDGLCEAFWLDGKIQGNRIMTEVELEPKTLRRYVTIFQNYLDEIEVNEFADAVLYLFPLKYLKGATRLLKSVPMPDCPDRDNLMAKRNYRFLIGSLEGFPLGITYIHTGETVNLSTKIPDELE